MACAGATHCSPSPWGDPLRRRLQWASQPRPNAHASTSSAPPSPALAAHTREVRRAEARKRHGLHGPGPAAPPQPGPGLVAAHGVIEEQSSVLQPGQGGQATEAPSSQCQAPGERQVLSLDLLLDQAELAIPHDEVGGGGGKRPEVESGSPVQHVCLLYMRGVPT